MDLSEGRALRQLDVSSPEALAIDRRLRSAFERAKTVKVSASRRGTSERYLLARGFRGP